MNNIVKSVDCIKYISDINCQITSIPSSLAPSITVTKIMSNELYSTSTVYASATNKADGKQNSFNTFRTINSDTTTKTTIMLLNISGTSNTADITTLFSKFTTSIKQVSIATMPCDITTIKLANTSIVTSGINTTIKQVNTNNHKYKIITMKQVNLWAKKNYHKTGKYSSNLKQEITAI